MLWRREHREPEARLTEFQRDALVHTDALLRTANHMVRSTVDAEDIVQETCLRAWKSFDTYERDTNCRGWLFSIMFNVIHTHWHNLKRRREDPLPEFEEEDEQKSNVVYIDPLRQIEQREVFDLIAVLAPEHRAVLWLVVVEEFTYREVAEMLGVPIGTVMSRLHRARNELRRRLRTNNARAAES